MSSGKDKATFGSRPERERPGASDDIAGYVPGDEFDEEDISVEEEPIPENVAQVASTLPFVAIDWEANTSDADGKLGAEVIQTLVKRLPNSPGVYRMVNAAGDVLYVGKAHSLKKRVSSYAQGRFHTSRIGRMVRETMNNGICRHSHRNRSASARSKSYQALTAAL